MPNNLEGQTLGKYRILQALGRGGMAQVYRAYHPQLDRYVAIKVLRADLLEQEEFLERFRREARAVSALRHPSIVQVFDFDVQDDLYYMVMELLEGDTLRARLNQYRVRGKCMPLAEVMHILTDVLNGLEYAHREGVIHRDIKPSNILLTRRGQAVLTDFGIAQILGATQYTITGALLGTLHYMSPEQGLKGTCDGRSDIYSLGIVLYEMLTGSTPFDAETPLAILLKHLNEPVPPPSRFAPSLPPVWDYITLKALSKDPAERFQSAAEMLEQVMATQPPENVSSLGRPHSVVISGPARLQIVKQPITEEETALENSPAPWLGQAQPSSHPPTNLLETLVSRIRPISPISAAFISLVLFTVVNLFAAFLNKWGTGNLFWYAWPFELFLITALLGFIGWGTQTPWMLTPGVILLANASLLTYSTLTSRWADWTFLWMFEPLIIGLAMYLPYQMARRTESQAQGWGKLSGLTLASLSILFALLTCLTAFVIS
ncbi:MAG: hypothetical protein DDG60_10005 [Anaerolineae bacterium]|nr:MAG: hypothetical protein DDG60_10005 [Anaerolineae bacterium]